MTEPWKRLVLSALEANKKAGRRPANLSQLATDLPADKRGIYETFDLERDPPQMGSAYVDDICALLKISPPMLESPLNEKRDDELERDLDEVRAMPPNVRRAMLVLARELKR